VAAGQSAAPSLDFEEFRTRVQPIFTAKRDGLMTCLTCHNGKVGTRLRLQPLPEGATTWSAEDARKNFDSDGLQGAPTHGLTVSPDGTRLWSTGKVYGYAYVHSLPDLKEVGRVFVGQHPEWVTFTPDGRYVYVAAAGDNAVFVVDTATLTEVARVPGGNVPKRNATAILRVP
jgi:YVTN family beta-propeller protein